MFRHRGERGIGLILCGIILIFPVAVGAIYINLTTYDWDAPPVMAEAATGTQTDIMVRELEARLRETPDPEGYRLLGRSYAALGKYGEAADAFYEAWNLTQGQNALITIDYAEALILTDQRTLRTSAGDLLENALQMAPNDPRALWYGGLSALAREDRQLAAQRWTRLLETNIEDDVRKVVQEQLAALSLEGEVQLEGIETEIATTVDISPELRDSASENDLMFIIARDLDNPMPPVAVKRVRVGDFPVTVKISDANVMIPGRKLADVTNLALVARISKSGNAFENPGDLYGQGAPETAADGSISAAVMIENVVDE
jgi:cytochrome c-type biogenesis protein CcmH